MKISFLILSHNRPNLFNRCINSILSNCPEHFKNNIEIIVNNDSNDIAEIESDITIRYFYNDSKNLSDLYSYIFDKSCGEYVYFLEDDDIILDTFFDNIIPNLGIYDLIMFGYVPYDFYNEKKFKIFFKNIVKKYYSIDEYFNIPLNIKYFQFSQYLFKKNILDRNDFPKDNCLFNDYKIIWHLKYQKFLFINKLLYKQTTDAKDNISFIEYCKDERWKQIYI